MTSRIRFPTRLTVILLALAPRAHAGTVEEVKESYVRFSEDLPVKVRDKYMTRDANGHATSYLLVTRVSDNFAAARVMSGKPSVGEETFLVRERQEIPVPEKFHFPLPAFRALANYATATLRVDSKSPFPSVAGRTIEMKGRSIGGGVGAELSAAPWLTLTPSLTYESVSVDVYDAGGSSCAGGPNCFVNLGLLGLQAGARVFPFPEHDLRPFLGLGLDFLFPVDRQASALDPKSFHFSVFYRFSGGLELRVAPQAFVSLAGTYSALTSTSSTSLTFLGGELDAGFEL